jgi:transcriptional regulator with XRE-family HTH domain
MELNRTTWKRLRGAAPLLTGGKGKPPLAGIPVLAAYEGRRVRKRCWTSRQLAGLRPADVAERMGLPRAKGCAYAEWERGQRQRPAAYIAAVGAAVGLDDAARQALDAEDAADHAAALAAFLDTPIPRTILIGSDYYLAPPELPNDDESAIAWARSCVAVAWRKGVLYLDRRRVLQIDFDGKLSPAAG